MWVYDVCFTSHLIFALFLLSKHDTAIPKTSAEILNSVPAFEREEDREEERLGPRSVW